MTITVQGKSEMKAQGYRSNKHCKPVMCIDTGEVYASVTDAAEHIGVHVTMVSSVALGKTRTCKGKRYCFVSDVTEHLDEIAESVRTREAKANAYEEIERRKNALQNAEEKVRKLEVSCSSMREKFENEIEKLNKAKAELYALQSNRGDGQR